MEPFFVVVIRSCLERKSQAGYGMIAERRVHATHVCGERGLVTDGRGDTTEEGGHFRTGLGEAEDVVDEEQDILAFLVTEVLCDGEACEGDTGAGTRGLVHLTKDQGDL